MLPTPGGIPIDAVAVELSSVPASAVLVAVVAVKALFVGTTRTNTCVPVGTFDAPILTVTLPVMADGKLRSGAARLPDGFAGAATPLTDVTRSVGSAVGMGRAGNCVKDVPAGTPPVNVLVDASIRRRPVEIVPAPEILLATTRTLPGSPRPPGRLPHVVLIS
jgi:hypothetical protein